MGKAIVSNGEIDDNSKCFTACVVKAANLIQDGKLNEIEIKGLDPSIASVDFEPCANVTGSDECDTNFQLVKCAVQEYSKVHPDVRLY